MELILILVLITISAALALVSLLEHPAPTWQSRFSDLDVHILDRESHDAV